MQSAGGTGMGDSRPELEVLDIGRILSVSLTTVDAVELRLMNVHVDPYYSERRKEE